MTKIGTISIFLSHCWIQWGEYISAIRTVTHFHSLSFSLSLSRTTKTDLPTHSPSLTNWLTPHTQNGTPTYTLSLFHTHTRHLQAVHDWVIQWVTHQPRYNMLHVWLQADFPLAVFVLLTSLSLSQALTHSLSLPFSLSLSLSHSFRYLTRTRFLLRVRLSWNTKKYFLKSSAWWTNTITCDMEEQNTWDRCNRDFWLVFSNNFFTSL